MSAKLLALERDTESSSSGSFGSGLKHSEVAEQSRETDGSSGLSSSASSSVISLMTKEVVDWKEGPKQGKGDDAFELPGDSKSGVNEGAAGKENRTKNTGGTTCLSVPFRLLPHNPYTW